MTDVKEWLRKRSKNRYQFVKMCDVRLYERIVATASAIAFNAEQRLAKSGELNSTKLGADVEESLMSVAYDLLAETTEVPEELS